MYKVVYSDELYHHGILGMKWGVWNAETRARRNGSSNKKPKRVIDKKISKAKEENQEVVKGVRHIDKYLLTPEGKKERQHRIARSMAIGLTAFTAATAAYSAVKIGKVLKDTGKAEDAIKGAKRAIEKIKETGNIRNGFNEGIKTYNRIQGYRSEINLDFDKFMAKKTGISNFMDTLESVSLDDLKKLDLY